MTSGEGEGYSGLVGLKEVIKEMGWETDEGFDDCKQITIPEEFNEVYNSYNELQKQQEELNGTFSSICAEPIWKLSAGWPQQPSK